MQLDTMHESALPPPPVPWLLHLASFNQEAIIPENFSTMLLLSAACVEGSESFHQMCTAWKMLFSVTVSQELLADVCCRTCKQKLKAPT